MSNRKHDLRGAALRSYIGFTAGHDPGRCDLAGSSTLCDACGQALQARIAGRYVEGAPYQLGDLVQVVRFSDTTANRHYRSWIGRVIKLHYTGGVAESFPSDPMVCLRFGQKKRRAEYWAEELQLVQAGRLRRERETIRAQVRAELPGAALEVCA
jgi:hypothetical protein